MRGGAVPGRILSVTVLSVGLAVSPASARAFPNEISLGAGVARFGPDEDGLSESSLVWQGSIRYDRFFRDGFFLGALADIAMVYCPICDEKPHDDLRTFSLVGGARFELRPFSFQLGAGMGIAKVEDERLVSGEEAVGKFTAFDIPMLSKIAFEHDFESLGFGLGLGLEAKYHLNFENDALSMSVPLSISF